MSRSKQRFDFRDLLVAASNSYCASPAFLGDHLERSPIALQRGVLAGQGLPALDNDVNVLRVEFQPVADALGEFGGSERGTRSEEGLVHQLAALQMVQDGAAKQFDGFLRG